MPNTGALWVDVTKPKQNGDLFVTLYLIHICETICACAIVACGLYVSMYVCMYVCIYVCVYVCV